MFAKLGPKGNSMALKPEQVNLLLKMLQDTHEVELSCPECAEQLDLYAQKILDGEPIEGVLKLVREHLEACAGCDDEFHLVLETIRAIDENQ